MAVRIGTSGFIYEHWRGRFYSPSARGSELEQYARVFDTVELNVTFYRMPSAATFRSWATRVPKGFLFAVKASRYLTHVKRLREPADSVTFLVERATELGSHLGPILLQLPPDMPADIARLEATLDAFPPSIYLAVEPRHESWFSEDLRAMLTARGAALCLADRRGPADADLADGRLDVPAVPRGPGKADAVLRRASTRDLGGSHRRCLGSAGGRVRLLQQRPPGLRASRRRMVRPSARPRRSRGWCRPRDYRRHLADALKSLIAPVSSRSAPGQAVHVREACSGIGARTR